MEWIQERMGVLELEGAFRDISWGFAVKEQEKNEVVVAGRCGIMGFFFLPFKTRGIFACLYILVNDPIK